MTVLLKCTHDLRLIKARPAWMANFRDKTKMTLAGHNIVVQRIVIAELLMRTVTATDFCKCFSDRGRYHEPGATTSTRQEKPLHLHITPAATLPLVCALRYPMRSPWKEC